MNPREVPIEPSPSSTVESTESRRARIPEATTDGPVSNKRVTKTIDDSEDVSSQSEIFISHRWESKPKPGVEESDKRKRTKRDITNVTSMGNVYSLTQADDEDHEVAPDTYEEAVKLQEWRNSMSAEIKALKNRGCWRVVETPRGVRLIKSKYVYKIKRDWNNRIIKRKSRLVVQGFSQIEGKDYNETYAPVAKATTFRIILALSKVLGLHIHQLDVDSAFPYANLDEDVYMTPVPGMDIREGFCLKLLKSLYGLKQAPRNWNKNIVAYIKSLGFKQCVLDNCLFVKNHGKDIYLISLYVDDILIAGSDLSVIESIKHAFTMQYEMKDMGELNYYLGMKVTRTEDYISLDQKAYIKDILKKYAHLVAAAGDREYTTPMERDLKLRKNERMTQKQLDYVHVFPYQNIIGALLYLAINTRPDISYAVGVRHPHTEPAKQLFGYCHIYAQLLT